MALQESYYQVFLNSRGLKEFGIEAGKPDPPDFVSGSILRDAAGKPTGIIKGDIAATRPVRGPPAEGRARPARSQHRGLVTDMNRAGLTTFGVAGCNADVLEIFQRWKAKGRLTVRTSASAARPAGSPEQVERSFQLIARMKLFQGDSSIDDVVFGESVYRRCTTDVRAESIHRPISSSSGVARAGDRQGRSADARPRGAPDTIDAFLDQIEAVNKEYPIRNLRWTLAHVNQINAAQLERMKKLGMYAAVHPWAVINGAIMHEGFGDSAGDMPPLATIQQSGITWGLGSDGTAANQYLPLIALQFAVTGQMAGGLKVMRQPIDREDALIAYTRKNAYFVFQEDNLGSLQAGKLADLVVLDRDYLTVPADQIKDIKPVMTVVGGRIVFQQ